MKTFTKNAIALFVAGALLGVLTPAVEAVIIHQSTETYFADGGTEIAITNPINAIFDVGPASGGVLWEILEKGFHNDNGTTTITYTVGNDGIGPAMPIPGIEITSFHIPANPGGQIPIAVLDPLGWSHTVGAGGAIDWSTTVAGDLTFGIAENLTKNEFSVTYSGLQNITFAAGAAVDLSSAPGTLIGSNTNQWMVSVIPAPGAIVLGAMGMGMVGWVRRRFQ